MVFNHTYALGSLYLAMMGWFEKSELGLRCSLFLLRSAGLHAYVHRLDVWRCLSPDAIFVA